LTRWQIREFWAGIGEENVIWRAGQECQGPRALCLRSVACGARREACFGSQGPCGMRHAQGEKEGAEEEEE
jgi:hypothetical protein